MLSVRHRDRRPSMSLNDSIEVIGASSAPSSPLNRKNQDKQFTEVTRVFRPATSIDLKQVPHNKQTMSNSITTYRRSSNTFANILEKRRSSLPIQPPKNNAIPSDASPVKKMLLVALRGPQDKDRTWITNYERRSSLIKK
ncbi:Stradb [Acrasis kona]|uniref:Stradb n=1 Tax=Acrasis kona TaxID=1008807 RepID=A0AAW2Z9Z6_9EUKA